MVFARGSGQGLGGTEAVKFFNSTSSRLDSTIRANTYELGSEAHGGAVYPAVGVGGGSLQSFLNSLDAEASWLGGLGGEYRDSVTSGVTELTSYLRGRTAQCPDEVFVLGGYSQGAQTVGDALGTLESSLRDRIAFVALFGDPKLYLPEGRGVFPSACRGEKSAWRRGSVSCWTDNGILESRIPYLPTDLESDTGSWCDADDGICNGNLTDLALHSDHSQYADSGAEIDEAAREIAIALEAHRPDLADEIDTTIILLGVGTAGLDVAFVIDTTGSMAGRINAARAIAEAAGSDIVDMRGRVALTEYRDAGDPFVSRVVTPLTTDVNAFRTALGGLFVAGGGDTPEALLHALMTTFNTLDWTSGATKAAVVLTDAGYHDPDRAAGYTLADVVARSLEIDPVNIYPVVPSFLQSTYTPLAEQTSGRVTIDTGNTADALLEAIGEIQTRPVALLGSSQYLARPGETMLFDASGSYDADSTISAYEWDFDGDGVTDRTTMGPTTTHSYPARTESLVELRVRSADGGIANATAPLRIDDVGLAALTAGTPTNVRAEVLARSGRARTVRISWNDPSSGGAVDSWVVRNGASDVVARRAAGIRSVDIADVPLSRVTFDVAAVNRYGPGPEVAVTIDGADVSPQTPQGQGDAIQLPDTRDCVSRRQFVIHLNPPRRATWATIGVTGRMARILRRPQLRRPIRIDLRGVPKGTFVVTITIRTADSRTVRQSRRYRTCVRRGG